jgi:hypothetical protein
MAIIYSYPETTQILLTDMLIGTSTIRVAGKKKNLTKNFTIETLGGFIHDNFPTQWGEITGILSNQTDLQVALDSKQSNITLTTIGTSGPSTFIDSVLNIPNYTVVVPTKTSDLINDGEDGIHPFITAEDIPPSASTLNDVLTNGNISLLDANIGGLGLYDLEGSAYSTLTTFDHNFIFTDYSGNTAISFEQGNLNINKSNSIAVSLSANLLTVSRGYYLPDAAGTIALTSDLTPYLLSTTAASTYYPIPTGTISQYIRGDGTFATFPTIPTIGTWGTLNYPAWTTGTPFVKMTAVGTFALDTNTYLTGITSSDVTTALGYTPVTNARTLTINGVGYDLTANRSWTIATSSSPLTTKGDLYTFSTVDARLPVGTDGQILTANSSVAEGLSWQDNYADWTSVVKHIVKNNGLSGTITKGTAVYVTGSNGTNMLVGRASNVSEATSSKTMGLMQSDITTTGTTQTGFVVTEGLLAGLNTAGQTAGDPVWLGVNGALIYGLINKPYAPANLVFIGIVTKISAGNGEIFVNVQNGFELNEIHDVDLKTTIPVNGDILGFNGTLWVNKTIAGWLGYTPANASGTTNYLPKFTGASTLGNSLIFDNGTNVGIGTTSPAVALDIQGTGTVQTRIVSASGGELRFNVDTGGRVGTYSNSDLLLVTNGAERIRITNVGNVGIGTSTPSSKLQVNDTTAFAYSAAPNVSAKIGASGTGGSFLVNTPSANSTYESGLAIDGTYTSGKSVININAFGVYSGGPYSADLAFKTSTTTTLSERMRITNTGNVGIGTTAPTNAKLKVSGASASGAIMSEDTTSTTSFVRVLGDISSQNLFNWQSGTALRFATSNQDYSSFAERMRITNTGNVGIGTTAPAEKLHVSGASTVFQSIFESSNGAISGYFGGIQLGNNASSQNAKLLFSSAGDNILTIRTSYSSGTTNKITFEPGGTEVLRLQQNGSILIGTTANIASSKLTVNSTTQGFLPPRMTTTEKNAIASPTSGLVVYDTTLGKLCVRGAAAWETITSI